MKYVIPGALLLWTLLMLTGVVFCVVYAFTSNPSWMGVATGLFLTFVVSGLATSAAFDAVKDW